MTMDTIFDLLLVTISGCSALYCWMLGRRLRALQNLRKGVGQAMVNLTKSVTAVESNAVKLNREARAAVAELQAALAKVDACEGKVDVLLETMDRQARETWKEYRSRTDEAKAEYEEVGEMVRTSIKDARLLCEMMNRQLIKLAEVQPAAVAPKPRPQSMSAPANTIAPPAAAPAPVTASAREDETSAAERRRKVLKALAEAQQAAARQAARAEAVKAAAPPPPAEPVEKVGPSPRIAELARKLAAKPQAEPPAQPRKRPANPFVERAVRQAAR
jgi:hypothetical protein